MASELMEQGFVLGIPEGRDLSYAEMQDLGIRSSQGKYVAFPLTGEGFVYGISLRNTRDVRCEVELLNQGTYIGTYILEAYGNPSGLDSMVIHGIEGGGNFIHYPDDTQGAVDSGQYGLSDSVRGLVKAIFYPDTTPPRPPIQKVKGNQTLGGDRGRRGMSKGRRKMSTGGGQPKGFTHSSSSDRGGSGGVTHNAYDGQEINRIGSFGNLEAYSTAVGGTTGQIGVNADQYVYAQGVRRGPEYRLSLRLIFVRAAYQPRPLGAQDPPPIRRRQY